MNSMLLEVARRYQAATGVGLPFSTDSDDVMLAALEASFRTRNDRLRALAARDQAVEEMIEARAKFNP